MEKAAIYDWVESNNFEKNSLDSLRNRFRKGMPYPHIVIDNFLQVDKARLLLKELKKEEFKEKEADLFKFNQTDDLYFSKNKKIKEFHKACCNWEFFNFISHMTGVKFKGTLDMAGTLYESADYLLCHDDELEGRKIAYVLYLSEEFGPKDGGAFCLFDSVKGKPNKIVKKYGPRFNRLLLFEVSEKSFHEVEENLSKKTRYAISGWLH